MTKPFAIIGALVALAAIVAVTAIVLSPEAARGRQITNRYAEQHHRLNLESAQRWQGTYEPVVQTAGAAAIVAVTAAGVAGAGAVAYALALALVNSARGLHPEYRWRIRELEANKAVMVSAEQNRHALPIQSLTYSPHFSNKVDQQGVLPGDTAHDSAPVAVPSFAQLLQSGRVGQGNPLILGYSEGKELPGSWLDLYSTAVAGLSGTGKTTSQRFLAAQTALQGARFVVADPHYGAAEDSLGGTLAPLLAHCGLCDVAHDDKTILDAVKMVQGIGAKRIAGASDRTPVILWVDESTALLGRSSVGPALAELLESIAQEFRKVAVYASVSGQIWTGNRAGGTALRDSLASCLVHRMKRSQARMLVSTEAARLVETLHPGQAVLYRTSGQTDTITIPNTTQSDVQRVAGLLTGDQPVMDRLPQAAETGAARQPDGSPVVACPDQAYTAQQSGSHLSAEAARVQALFLEGKSLAEIVYQTRDVKSSSGRRYQTALAEVQELLREAITPRAH